MRHDSLFVMLHQARELVSELRLEGVTDVMDSPEMKIIDMTSPNKTLHTNRRPALGFGLSIRLFGIGCCHDVIVRAAVGELGR